MMFRLSSRPSALFPAVLLFFLSRALCAQDPPPALVWRYAVGGRITSFPAEGPAGDLYIIAEDRALHALNPETGRSKWIYRPGGRLRSLLMVAPDGSIYIQNEDEELFAVTAGGDGRWKLRMNRSPAALPAAAPDGKVILPLTGGRILGLSRRGRILWTHDESAEASSAPVVDADGMIWVPLSDGRILVLDGNEEVGFSPRLSGAVTALALDGIGRVWGGTLTGMVAVIDGRSGKILHHIRAGTSRVAAFLTHPGGAAEVFLASGVLVSYDDNAVETGRRHLAALAGAPSAGGEGSIYFPAVDGSIRVLGAEGSENILRGRSVLAEPLLTSRGLLVAGGEDWILYAWKAERPGPGWRQFRGGPGRTGTFPFLSPVMDRETARGDIGFYVREAQARSDDIEERYALLEEMESYADSETMKKAMPWAPLLLEDLAGGLLRGRKHQRNHPTVRSRAYELIGREEDVRFRSLLLGYLRQENDPHALVAGFRALGTMGSDWDGASTRLMADRYRKIHPPGEKLAMDTARALVELVRYNGFMPHPAGYDLMDELISLRLSDGGRRQMMIIFHELTGF